MNIRTAANNAINKENKRLGVITARIKRLGMGNRRVPGVSVTAAKVSVNPVSNNDSNGHA